MSNEKLTQEEIDSLMYGNMAAASETTNDLTQMEKDIIGEVANISMSQAATTLSELLGLQVLITTPRVKVTSISQVLKNSPCPKTMTTIAFKKGIKGNNMLLLDISDSGKIANLMMGGDGQVMMEALTELELSALGEAMNQMIGSASTAMATMFNRVVDILPPEVNVWTENEGTPLSTVDVSNEVCAISFQLVVENVLESTIMQIFTMDAVKDMIEIMLGDEAEVIEAAPTPKPVAEVPVQEETEKVAVQKPKFQTLEVSDVKNTPKNLDLIMDVPLEFSVMLGESKKTIRDILALGTGSVVELDKLTDEPLNIYVNGKMIAQGEVVVINESFGIRITNILSKENRLRNI